MSNMSKLRNVIEIQWRAYHSLRGRTVLSTHDFTCRDIKSLLWTAIELKLLAAQGRRVRVVRDKWVSYLTHSDDFFQPSIYRGAALVGVHICKMIVPDWDRGMNLVDLRHYYECEADMMLTQSRHHDLIKPLYHASRIPMFNLSSRRCSLLCVLTDLMTYQLHFGRLCGLNVMWFGEPCALINTYIPMTHALQMNIRYHCHAQSPSILKETLRNEVGKSTQIKEYDPKHDKDYIADVLVVREDAPDWSVITEMMRNQSHGMLFVRAFPSARKVPCPEILRVHQKYDERTENIKFVVAALMLRLMSEYQHESEKPSFQ